MVTSCPPSSIALISRPRAAMSSMDERGALVAGRLQRVQARARSRGQRGLRAGEERRGDEAEDDQEGGQGRRHRYMLAQTAENDAAGRAEVAAARRRSSALYARAASLAPLALFAARPLSRLPFSNARRTSAAESRSNWAMRGLRFFRPLGGDGFQDGAVLMEPLVLDRHAAPTHPERADERRLDHAAERSDQPVAGGVENPGVEAHVGADQAARRRS